ncbi:MAG: hypothetical protein U1F52_08005 [Burkholderiales bacterium]
MPSRALALALTLPLVLGGCGAFRSYRAEMDETLNRAAAGDVPGAIKQLNKNNDASKKDMLYFMELSELRRLSGDYKGSFAALQQADAEVQAWEAAARLDPGRSVGQAGSFIVNDRVRTYEGHDYEKVMITTRMAMDHLAQGDIDNARVEIKRTHEREDLIAEIRSKEYLRVEEQARNRGTKASMTEIAGYPVQTLDSPDVNELRNGYQNALSHYLAGFIYESLGETSLAAPGYRKAIELRPGQPVLEQSLGELDTRVSAGDDGHCDTLIVIETGSIPGRISQNFNLPIPIVNHGAFLNVPISFPVLPNAAIAFQAPDVLVDRTTTLPTAHVLNLDAMARRALKDEMPGIVLRAVVRATTKATAQYELQRQMAQKSRKQEDALGAALALFAFQVGGMVLEQADERGWRTLPGQVSVARQRLAKGKHQIDVRTESGTSQFEVNLTGRHALVAVRLFRGRGFVSLPPDAQVAPASKEAALPASGDAAQPMYAEVRVVDFPPSSLSRRSQQ